jgi:hypothetical protein
VKIKESELLSKTEESALRLLQCVPGLEIVRIETLSKQIGTAPDLVIDVRSRSLKKQLVLEAKTCGEPRVARMAVNQLLLYRAQNKDVYCIFVAPYVSLRAAEICRDENIGYLDLSGNCRLSFDGIFIERDGKPNKFAEKRDLGTLYSPKATRVLRILLCETGRNWRTTDLAEAANVSLGLASNVKKLINDREWIKDGKAGFTLSRPLELLKEWSENYSFQQNELRDYYSFKPRLNVESDLAKSCKDRNIKYALTSFSAAARMAPAVRYQRAFAYVEFQMEEIAYILGLKQVSSGANVTLLTPYDVGVFAASKEYAGVRTVCPIQVYLDLVTIKGRGEEAAAAILEEVIEPQW